MDRFGVSGVAPDGRYRTRLFKISCCVGNLTDAGDGSVQRLGIAWGHSGCIMEHRGVRYELRRAVGNNEWVWTVYTPAPKQGKVSGDRYFAMQRAISIIDRCYGRDPAAGHPQTTFGSNHGAA